MIPAPAGADREGRRFSLTVVWAGPRQTWLELAEARAELEGVELSRVAPSREETRAPDVVHVTRDAIGQLRPLRSRFRELPFVLDLTREADTALTPGERGEARGAEVVLCGSRWEADELRRRSGTPASRAVSLPRPVDLEQHAPEAQLDAAKGRGRDLRRFRRFHRLAGPVVLFAGPFTEQGGLDALVETIFLLRERHPDLRLAAIPHGPTDPRYRDRCEMRMLSLGHHGIVEWSPPDEEIPFWYAIAAVVCAPARGPVSPEPAKYAAAAARPFVGSDVAPFREHVEDGVTGRLVASGEPTVLEPALDSLLTDEVEASRLGTGARARAEAEYSPASAVRALVREWRTVLGAC
jgi:glycosyltransferase involved in cell wall biosynthesis